MIQEGFVDMNIIAFALYKFFLIKICRGNTNTRVVFKNKQLCHVFVTYS